ncbi:hypothetical protein EVAR_9629_1 [Eumeta japonica]|uniref:Uncharacterized protein n=1 Tax=Eumeta variegata TaxID=151549 RepID=A0A4C1TKV4_EUMVA|nr:hypothetical protein EVAR_9629_1 [Eumeta japonica]
MAGISQRGNKSRTNINRVQSSPPSPRPAESGVGPRTPSSSLPGSFDKVRAQAAPTRQNSKSLIARSGAPPAAGAAWWTRGAFEQSYVFIEMAVGTRTPYNIRPRNLSLYTLAQSSKAAKERRRLCDDNVCALDDVLTRPPGHRISANEPPQLSRVWPFYDSLPVCADPKLTLKYATAARAITGRPRPRRDVSVSVQRHVIYESGGRLARSRLSPHRHYPGAPLWELFAMN